jgi:rhomboid protease GluP
MITTEAFRAGSPNTALPAEPTDAAAKTFPVVTSLIMATIVLVFLAEMTFGVAPDQGSFRPAVSTLLAFGGLQYPLVVSGQWHRLFSAPLLHADLKHVALNSVALWYAGRMLEGMIGRLWFAAIFILGGLAGCAMSLAVNGPNIVSVGASGALMAVLSATIVLAWHDDAVTTRRGKQGQALFLLIPSLIPIGFSAGKIDYAGHFGGAIGGVILGGMLLAIWSKHDAMPGLRRVAAAIMVLGLLGTGYSASANADGYRSFGLKRLLIPAAEIPTDTAAIYAKSAALLEKYPRDPRAREFAAMSLVKWGDLAGAEQQMRIGLAEEDIMRMMLVPTAKSYFQSYLALILYDENRKDEAKEFARAACQSTSPVLASRREKLIKLALCETAKS